MISKAEILELRNEWQLRADVIEKDYVLGLLLGAISRDPSLETTWIFKGGTALRKCYYETYRFSEDLDFTIVEAGPEEPEALVAIFEGIGRRLYDDFGLEILVDADSFRRRKNRRGRATTRGLLSFRGPLQRAQPPRVQLDLSSDEILVRPAQRRHINHPYGDDPPQGLDPVACYSLAELLAEKVRALVERCRPRDLYDVVNTYRHADLVGASAEVRAILAAKCAHAGIATVDLAAIEGSMYRAELQQEWESMLAHQLPHLPPYEEFWGELPAVFAWLEGRTAVAMLPRAQLERDALDTEWIAPRVMTSWRTRAPLEPIRFAGANRLKIELDYRPEQGRIGPRVVEPYALRMTRTGNLLLYVLNDHGQLRSYRVDRIRSARVTNDSFVPRFLVEF